MKLMNLCSKIGSGATPKGGDANYKTEGIYLIRSQNILDFKFSKEGLAFIDNQQAKELANVELQDRDVLINITGDSVARVCQVPHDVLPARVNQHVAILRADKKRLNPEFLKYSLLAKPVKELLLTFASTGATRKALTKGMLEEFEISVPDIKTQSSIASILTSLDDKIELNRRMNQTLEQMAQALFNHYFVDNIDPGNLPEGCKMGKVGDYIQTISKTHSFGKPEIIFLNTSDISAGKVLHSNYSLVEGLPGQAKKSIKRNDILFSEIRPANKRFAFINFDSDDYVVSTKLMVLRSKSNIDSLFFYFLLTQEQTLSYLQNIAESRSGTFPQITFDQVKEIEFSFPDEGFIQEFASKTLKPIYDLIFNNEKETKTLSIIRDTLLPKLMSGEIDISELNEEKLKENYVNENILNA